LWDTLTLGGDYLTEKNEEYLYQFKLEAIWIREITTFENINVALALIKHNIIPTNLCPGEYGDLF